MMSCSWAVCKGQWTSDRESKSFNDPVVELGAFEQIMITQMPPAAQLGLYLGFVQPIKPLRS